MKKIIDICNYERILDFMIKNGATAQEIEQKKQKLIKEQKIIINA